MSLSQFYAVLIGAVISGALGTTFVYYEVAEHSSSSNAQKTSQPAAQTVETSLQGPQDYHNNLALDLLEPEGEWKISPGQMKATTFDTPNGARKVFHFPKFPIGKISNSLVSELSLGKIGYHDWIAQNDVVVPADIPLSLELDYRYFPAPFKSAPIMENVNPAEFAELIFRGSPVSKPDQESQSLATILKVAKGWTNLQAIALYSIHEDGEPVDLLSQLKNVRYLVLEGTSIPRSKLLKGTFWAQLKQVALLKSSYKEPPPDWIIAILSKSKNLERLELDRTAISISVLEKLRNCPKLTHVIIRNGPSDDATAHGKISDGLLDVLIKLPHLKRLSLQSTIVTPNQFKTLAKSSGIREILVNSSSMENLKISKCNDARVKICVE